MKTKVPSYMIGASESTVMSYKHFNYRLKLIYLETKSDFGYLITENRRKIYYTDDFSLVESVYFNVLQNHIQEQQYILNLDEVNRLNIISKSICETNL